MPDTVDQPQIRLAERADLEQIVDLLRGDYLGRARETATEDLDPVYELAFNAIDNDPNQRLIVMEDAGVLIGCLQLTFIPGLSHKGAWRGQIESVRIATERRGGGLGHMLISAAIDQCRDKGCRMVQLTSDKSRHDAIRFYERLGFVASHEGFKLRLDV